MTVKIFTKRNDVYEEICKPQVHGFEIYQVDFNYEDLIIYSTSQEKVIWTFGPSQYFQKYLEVKNKEDKKISVD